MSTYQLEQSHERGLVESLTKGKLNLPNRHTWEEDDIVSFLTWGIFTYFHSRPVEYCKLYRVNRGGYLARVKILLKEEGEQELKLYVDHMKKLCYGNNLNGRIVNSEYQIRGDTAIIHFLIKWPIQTLEQILLEQSENEEKLQILGRHPLRN